MNLRGNIFPLRQGFLRNIFAKHDNTSRISNQNSLTDNLGLTELQTKLEQLDKSEKREGSEETILTSNGQNDSIKLPTSNIYNLNIPRTISRIEQETTINTTSDNLNMEQKTDIPEVEERINKRNDKNDKKDKNDKNDEKDKYDKYDRKDKNDEKDKNNNTSSQNNSSSSKSSSDDDYSLSSNSLTSSSSSHSTTTSSNSSTSSSSSFYPRKSKSHKHRNKRNKLIHKKKNNKKIKIRKLIRIKKKSWRKRQRN